MKISYLHYLYGEQTGLHHVRQFAQAARRLGCDIEVYDMHPGSSEKVRGAEGQASIRTKVSKILKRHLSRYLHDPKELIMTAPYTLKELRLLGVALPDVLLVRSSYLNLSCVPIARRLGLPLVIELNAPPEEARLYFDQYWSLPWLPEKLEGWKLRCADGVTVVSSWIKNHLLNHYGLEADRISVVPNGADIRIFRPDAKRDPEIQEAPGISPIVGFIGSFRKWHGSDLLGRMATAVGSARSNVRFLFIGDGPELGTVQEMTTLLGDRVRFTGAVPHDRVPGMVAAFDVAVLPDSLFYASPLKVIEWMAAGKALIAPRYEALEELVKDGVEGLLFPPRDGEALIRAVLRLVDNRELRETLGRAATERVRSSLTWEHNAKRVLAACEQALARHRSSRGGSA